MALVPYIGARIAERGSALDRWADSFHNNGRRLRMEMLLHWGECIRQGGLSSLNVSAVSPTLLCTTTYRSVYAGVINTRRVYLRKRKAQGKCDVRLHLGGKQKLNRPSNTGNRKDVGLDGIRMRGRGLLSYWYSLNSDNLNNRSWETRPSLMRHTENKRRDVEKGRVCVCHHHVCPCPDAITLYTNRTAHSH